ncbi:MAG: YceI family protein [Erythrobacter sp.]|jgi:polyisoprenoid-binding protein YceI|nr:YceI family protein [Erythrobacter sp.]
MHAIRILLLPILALLSGLAALAQQPGSGALDYRLDSNASDVSARVPFFGLSSKTARFPRMEGAVTIVPDSPERAVIDVTFDAGAIEAPDRVTLRRLRGEKFFWVEKYPVIRFKGRALKMTSARAGSLEGVLTARGVSRPQTLEVVFDSPPAKAVGQPISFTGKTTIDRRDYGMNSYQLIVGNEVDIELRARMVPR